MKNIRTRENVSSIEKAIIQTEIKKALLVPIRIISLIIILSGLFAIIFEVKYFKDVSLFVYAFRFFAVTSAFWVLIVTTFDIGKKHPVLLAHTLLISIIISFTAVIIYIPNTLVINSQITALIIFTSSIFLSWDLRHQIIVAIYYNLVFGATLFVNKDGIYFVDNIFAAVLFIMFLSVLSVIAVAINTRLRINSVIKTLRIAELQRKFKDIFDNSEEGLFQATLDGEILTANKAFYKIFELNNQVGKLSLTGNNIISNDEFSSISNLLMHNKIVPNYSLKIVQGIETKYVQLNCKLRQDTSIGSYIIEGSFSDITDHIKKETELKHAKEKAEESDKLKSEFLSQMSHEIRTPINAILSSVDFLEEELQGNYGEEVKTTFDIIGSSSKRIIRTVQLILNLAEVQSGLYKLKASKFDIYFDCLLLIFKEYEDEAKNKNIKFSVKRWIENTTIVTDEYSVNQIFRNVIDNSVKYTHSGSIDIDVDRDEDGRLTVEISDTGIGMSNDYIPDLYKNFSREERGFTRNFDGNGLGLALVKKYCDLNSSTITVKSKKNEGTSVKITFHNLRTVPQPITSF